MSKREKRAAQGLGAAEGGDTGAAMSLEELTRQGYNLPLAEADRGRQVAKPISILQIVPDAKQPRRQIPSVIRQQWDGQAANTRDLFKAWSEAFAAEAGRTLDEIVNLITAILEGREISPAEVYQTDKPDPARKWGVLGTSLMAVVNLAAEIRRDGLTNPITVVGNGDHYLIETGERRWLAFHLLNLFSDEADKTWERIPARIVPESSVWRQASENTARAQLNAIGMARQLSLLLMALYSDEPFVPFEEAVFQGVCDRAYYAQVADGNRWRIPRGKGEQVVSALGKTGDPTVLRKYRDLLRLPDSVWMLADDLNWTEYFIRTEIVEKAVDESGMISLAEFHAEKAGYRVTGVGHTVPTGTVSEDDEPDPTNDYNTDIDDDDGGQPPVEEPQIVVGAPVKIKMAGDKRFVVVSFEQDPNNPAQILCALYNDDMPKGTTVSIPIQDLILLDPISGDEPGTQDESDPDGDPSDQIPESTLNLLDWAYRRGAGALNEQETWFSSDNASRSIEQLNQLIEQGFLSPRTRIPNRHYSAAYYRISPYGCQALGREVLTFNFSTTPTHLPPGANQPGYTGGQRPPVSGAQAHAATGSTGKATPPVQKPQKSPEQLQQEQQERAEASLIQAIEDLKNQFAFLAGKIAVERITTVKGRELANGKINQIEADLRSFRNQLNGK